MPNAGQLILSHGTGCKCFDQSHWHIVVGKRTVQFCTHLSRKTYSRHPCI